MVSVKEIKNFLSRVRFGKMVCVLLTLAILCTLTACNNDVSEDDTVEVTPTTSGCLTCPVFELLYDAGESLCQQFHQKTAGPAIKLLWVAFGLWLAVHVIKFVGSVREPDVAGFWNGLAVRTFWVMLIALGLLANVSEIMTSIIDPIFGAFLNVGTKVIAGLPAGSEGTISCTAATPKEGLLCIVAAASERFWKAVLTAAKMISFLYIFMSPMLVISGCVAIVFTFLLVILTPLYLLETIFCYFIVLALLPMWIVAFAFPSTRKFTQTAWDYLMSVFVQILGVCMFLGLAAQIFSILMKKSFPNPAAYIAQILTEGPLQALMAPAILIFVSYFIYLFSEVILKVLNAVFGASLPSGGVVQRMAKAPAQKAAQLAQKGIGALENETFGGSADDPNNKEKSNRDDIEKHNDGKMSRADRRKNFGSTGSRFRGDGQKPDADSNGNRYNTDAYKNSMEGKSSYGSAQARLEAFINGTDGDSSSES